MFSRITLSASESFSGDLSYLKKNLDYATITRPINLFYEYLKIQINTNHQFDTSLWQMDIKVILNT